MHHQQSDREAVAAAVAAAERAAPAARRVLARAGSHESAVVHAAELIVAVAEGARFVLARERCAV